MSSFLRQPILCANVSKAYSIAATLIPRLTQHLTISKQVSVYASPRHISLGGLLVWLLKLPLEWLLEWQC